MKKPKLKLSRLDRLEMRVERIEKDRELAGKDWVEWRAATEANVCAHERKIREIEEWRAVMDAWAKGVDELDKAHSQQELGITRFGPRYSTCTTCNRAIRKPSQDSPWHHVEPSSHPASPPPGEPPWPPGELVDRADRNNVPIPSYFTPVIDQARALLARLP